MAPVMATFDTELTEVLGTHWTTLKAQSSEINAVHSILTLWKVTKDPLYNDLSADE